MTFLEEAIKTLNENSTWSSSSTLAIISIAENIDKIRQIVENNLPKQEVKQEIKIKSKQMKFWWADEEADFSDLTIAQQIINYGSKR